MKIKTKAVVSRDIMFLNSKAEIVIMSVLRNIQYILQNQKGTLDIRNFTDFLKKESYKSIFNTLDVLQTKGFISYVKNGETSIDYELMDTTSIIQKYMPSFKPKNKEQTKVVDLKVILKSKSINKIKAYLVFVFYSFRENLTTISLSAVFPDLVKKTAKAVSVIFFNIRKFLLELPEFSQILDKTNSLIFRNNNKTLEFASAITSSNKISEEEKIFIKNSSYFNRGSKTEKLEKLLELKKKIDSNSEEVPTKESNKTVEKTEEPTVDYFDLISYDSDSLSFFTEDGIDMLNNRSKFFSLANVTINEFKKANPKVKNMKPISFLMSWVLSAKNIVEMIGLENGDISFYDSVEEKEIIKLTAKEKNYTIFNSIQQEVGYINWTLNKEAFNEIYGAENGFND
jgi:ribosomal protein S8